MLVRFSLARRTSTNLLTGAALRSVISGPCTTPGRWIGFREDRPAVQPPQLRLGCALGRWERIRPDPFESPLAIAELWVSNPRMAGSAIVEWCPFLGLWTMSVFCAGPLRMPHKCWE